MAKRENESNKLSDLIPKMLQENRLQKGMDQMTVREAWVQVMGPGVANYTEEVTLKDQVLLVKRVRLVLSIMRCSHTVSLRLLR